MVNDSDDKLIRHFLKQKEKELPDDGFSTRVMRHLPGRADCFAQVWTLVCLTAGVLLFVHIDGFHLLAGLMQRIGVTLLDSGVFRQNPLHLALVSTVIGGYLGYKVYSDVVK